MFDKDIQINGKYATYWKALTQLPGNAVNSSDNHFRVFENYIFVYMLAPIIGLLHGKRSQPDPNDNVKDTAGMMAEIQIKNASKLKYIYRLVILMDESQGLTDQEKIDWAFREVNNLDAVKRGMKLYHEYFYGGLEILYDEFVKNCITDDDYVRKMFEMVSDFKEEQNIDELTVDIESLLRS